MISTLWQRLFAKKKSRNTAQRRTPLRQARPTLELLEQRQLMTAEMVGTMLWVHTNPTVAQVDIVTIDRTNNGTVTGNEFVVTERSGATLAAAQIATPVVTPFPFAGVTSLKVETYGGADQINIERIDKDADLLTQVEIYAGTENDTINLSPTTKRMVHQRADLYYVIGGDGVDALRVNDQNSLGSGRYDIHHFDIDVTNGTPIYYAEVENVDLNTGTLSNLEMNLSETYIFGTSANYLTVTSHNDNPDHFILGDSANTLNGLGTAQVRINGRGSYDTLLVKDLGTTSRTYQIGESTTVGSLERIGGVIVNYTGLDSIELDTGSNADTVNIYATPITPLTVDGGDSISDRLQLTAPYHATWNITGSNAGTLATTTTFRNIENLTGNAGRDRFVFSPGASLTGTIMGGSGWDTLDYSGFGSAVTVNLGTGMGHGCFVGLVEMVMGSSRGDNLTGSASADCLVVGGGSDTINGGSGADVLIGGSGGDSLNGGLGEDVLIGGTTNYDLNDAALDSIMREWTRPLTSLTDRLARLETTGSYLLRRGQTVFDDYAQDNLLGGTNDDVFWADPGRAVVINGRLVYLNFDVTPDKVSGEAVR